MHHTLDLLGSGREVVLAQDVGFVVGVVVEDTGLAAKPGAQLGQADVGAGRQEEGQDHAGERGVDARVEHADPQHQANHEVVTRSVDLGPCQGGKHQDAHERRRTPGDAGTLAVADGQDHDGQDVVGDGEGLEEDLGLGGHAVAQKRHDAEGEGDVGGDGDGPAVRSRRGVERQVDKGGRNHAADRGEHG